MDSSALLQLHSFTITESRKRYVDPGFKAFYLQQLSRSVLTFLHPALPVVFIEMNTVYDHIVAQNIQDKGKYVVFCRNN